MRLMRKSCRRESGDGQPRPEASDVHLACPWRVETLTDARKECKLPFFRQNNNKMEMHVNQRAIPQILRIDVRLWGCNFGAGGWILKKGACEELRLTMGTSTDSATG